MLLLAISLQNVSQHMNISKMRIWAEGTKYLQDIHKYQSIYKTQNIKLPKEIL